MRLILHGLLQELPCLDTVELPRRVENLAVGQEIILADGDFLIAQINGR